MNKRVLVTYGSKHGGTAEIAHAIADTLRAVGHDVECIPAAIATDVDSYDAVLVGGALYMFRWNRAARRFMRRHADALGGRPVWMFSSGPLDDSASRAQIPPVRAVEKLAASVRARGHVTFGGRLTRDVKGFPDSMMAKTHSGDWRDWGEIRRWAEGVAREIAAMPRRSGRAARPPRQWAIAALCLFVALTAMAGGLALLAEPDGRLVGLTSSTLQYTTYSSYLIPGALLLVVVGGSSLVAAAMVIHRHRLANLAVFCAGTALLVWIAVEMILLRAPHGLQLVYAALAIAMLAVAVRRQRRPVARRSRALGAL